MNFTELENIIGYSFNDKNLAVKALTHSSYVNENGGESYERLEFLGDSLLNFLVSDRLYCSEWSEGDMSNVRTQIVSRKPLSDAVMRIGLLDFMRVGKGLKQSELSDKCKSDLFESMLAAIYLDCNDINVCRKFLEQNLFKYAVIGIDYKTRLQELTVRIGKIKYDTQELNDGFYTRLYLNGELLAEGKGARKKDSQIDAARIAYEDFTKK